MDPEREIERLLKEHHAELVRSNRHKVYKFPGGQVYTMSVSPSDHCWADNALKQLRKLLGLVPDNRGSPGKRRPRHRARQRSLQHVHNDARAVHLRSWRQQMSQALGVELKRTPSPLTNN